MTLTCRTIEAAARPYIGQRIFLPAPTQRFSHRQLAKLHRRLEDTPEIAGSCRTCVMEVPSARSYDSCQLMLQILACLTPSTLRLQLQDHPVLRFAGTVDTTRLRSLTVVPNTGALASLGSGPFLADILVRCGRQLSHLHFHMPYNETEAMANSMGALQMLQLRDLSISGLARDLEDYRVLLSFLRSSPNLKKVTINCLKRSETRPLSQELVELAEQANTCLRAHPRVDLSFASIIDWLPSTILYSDLPLPILLRHLDLVSLAIGLDDLFDLEDLFSDFGILIKVEALRVFLRDASIYAVRSTSAVAQLALLAGRLEQLGDIRLASVTVETPSPLVPQSKGLKAYCMARRVALRVVERSL